MKNFEKHIDLIISTIKELAGYYPYHCENLPIFKKLPKGKALGCWLLEEYKEPIHLTHDEYVILKHIDDRWKWIARNGNINPLYVYENKPYKNKEGYVCWETDEGFWNLTLFVNVFDFIKWEDEEPYEIAKLIADYENEQENA